MELGSSVGSADRKQQGHRARKLLLRGFFLILIFTALQFTYLYREVTPCRKAGNCFGGAIGLGLDATLQSSARYLFQSYHEYIQLQLKKTLNINLRKLWTSRDSRRKVEVSSLIFQDLMKKGFLKRDDKSLCIGARVDEEVISLKEVGVLDVVGRNLAASPPLVVKGDVHKHPFENNTFDFEFSNAFDHTIFPALFVSEIERTLKPGGHAVIHVSLKGPVDKYSVNYLQTVKALISLFKNSDVMHFKEIDAFGFDTEVVFKKRSPPSGLQSWKEGNLGIFEMKNMSESNLVCKLKQKVIQEAEPLIQEEPRKPWITLKRNIKNIRYLPSIMNISGHQNYVYVDVGARNYVSSIGSWFKKHYPSQSYKFNIYAVEPDASFAQEYSKRKNVQLLPYAAWIRDENLLFGVSQEQVKVEGERGMGRIQHYPELDGEEGTKLYKTVRGFDFATWLIQTVTPDDFVVMKMDIEGTEFDVLPRMFDTGAICLVDELFLECHYNRWQRSNPGRTTKFTNSYGDCLTLFNAFRNSGILAHQWW